MAGNCLLGLMSRKCPDCSENFSGCYCELCGFSCHIGLTLVFKEVEPIGSEEDGDVNRRLVAEIRELEKARLAGRSSQ